MSTTISPSRQYTPDDLLKMSEGKRFELVDGRLEQKPMGTRASMAGARIISYLVLHCDEHPEAGWVFAQDAGYRCFPDDRNRIRRPDAYFIRRERLSPDRFDDGFITIPPDLAIEVLSPNDRAIRVSRKTQEYVAAGVRPIWIVEPELRLITIYRADGTVSLLHDSDELSGEDVLPGFRCPVSRLFGTVPTAPA